MCEAQDPQGLQCLLEELALLAGGGRRAIGQEAVVGTRLQQEVSCGGNDGGQGQGCAVEPDSRPSLRGGHPRRVTSPLGTLASSSIR